jgi:TatD DNase family protein
MQPYYVDAHLHLQDRRFGGAAGEVLARAAQAGVGLFFCNAIHEQDWAAVAELAAAHRQVVAFFGIHPWFSDAATDGWQQRLLAKARTVDGAVGIGETGLDRSCRIDFAIQKKLFAEHLDLAAEQSWPLAVHCVRAWGALVDLLTDFSHRNALPPVLIHSFNGSTEIMRRLAKLGCYLSYSEALAGSGQTKLRETFVRTPKRLMLLETDAPYAKNPEQKMKNKDAINEPADVAALYQRAAQLLLVEPAQLRARLWENATVFTNSNAAGR